MPATQSKYRGTTAYQLVHAELITAARYRGVTTYRAVGQLLGIWRPGNHLSRETADVVGAISADEVAQGRPMLSAVVVHSDDHLPGTGFFTCARDLGRLHSDQPADRQRFWEEEREAVYETWKRVFKV